MTIAHYSPILALLQSVPQSTQAGVPAPTASQVPTAPNPSPIEAILTTTPPAPGGELVLGQAVDALA